MQKNVLRILSGLLAVAMLSVVVIPALADEFGGGSFGGGAGRDQSSAAYAAYVQTLPSTGYTSNNTLSWVIIPDDFTASTNSAYKKYMTLERGSGSFRVYFQPRSVGTGCQPNLASDFLAPVDGIYKISLVTLSAYLARDDDSIYTTPSGSTSYTAPFKGLTYVSQDTVLILSSTSSHMGIIHAGADTETVRYFEGYFLVTCIPQSSLGDTYNINTRPTSIEGGNYGIIGDDGQLTVVNDNSSIVNETNNTFWNPVTGQVGDIGSWTYDYSDRSYNLTLDSGDTVTVTYGDEYITIQEGDTIYNVYYVIEGDGSGDACTHEWYQTGAVQGDCVTPAQRTYTCYLCNKQYTETDPVLGHDWQIKEVQESYTIYECSRCHEENKVLTGTTPPGGDDPTDSGDDDSIWSKLGELLGGILGGILALIESIISAILDALISLAQMILDKLSTVVEVVLRLLEEIPKLFGGFLAFLSAVFPFLPPELMTILTFGLAAVVFIGIWKAVRR